MTRLSMLAWISFVGVMAVPAVAQNVPVPVVSENVEDVAERLKVPEDSCEYRLRDGRCSTDAAGITSDRQLVKGAKLPAAVKAARAFRADIRMSFLVGSADLTEQARATLDRFAAKLVGVGRYFPFEVEGHTDRSGSLVTNRALSQARAASVVNYLALKGVDRSKMTARGYGFEQPMPGRSADDAANRRVEVVLR